MFNISTDAEEWFKHLREQSPFKEGAPSMHFYYLSLLVGFYSGKPKSLQNGKEFTKNWTNTYDPFKNKIVALFLDTELSRYSIDVKNKDEVKEHLKKYIVSHDSMVLSKDGMYALNDYSYSGYLKLRADIGDPPKSPTAFLKNYADILKKIKN